MAKIARIDDYSNPLILFYDCSQGCNCAVGGGIVDQDMFIIDIFDPSHCFPDPLAQFFNVFFFVETRGNDADFFQAHRSLVMRLHTTRHDLLFQLF